MKAYMGSGLDSAEGAVLIFAHTAKEAKKLLVAGWTGDLFDEFTDARVRWLKNDLWLFEEADHARLAQGQAHIIAQPRLCRICETWGKEGMGSPDGLCGDCRHDAAVDAKYEVNK